MYPKTKDNRKSLLKTLRLKIVALVVAVVAVLLLIVTIFACFRTGSQDWNKVNSALFSANYDAYEQSFRQSSAISSEGFMFSQFPFTMDDPLGLEPPEKPDFEERKIFRPDDMQNYKRSRPSFGGPENKGEYTIPVVTYVLENDKLKETDFGLMTAYLADNILSEAIPTIKNAADGTHNIVNLGVTFRKDSFEGVTHVAFTEISWAFSWVEVARTLLFAGLAILVLVGIVAWILSKKLTATLKTAWDNQERFIADASHDLKTPLTIILTNSSILKRNKDKTISEMSDWIDTIEEEATDMQQLTNAMLDMAKIDATYNKDVSQLYERIDFSKATKTVCLQIQVLAFESGLSFEHDIEPGLQINGIPDDIKRVVTTFVENAQKHAGEDDKITVTLKPEGNYAVLTVKNKCTYIPKDEIDTIFERFHHSSGNAKSNNADSKDTKQSGKFTSHGLGLSIAKRIIDQHNGEVEVISDQGAGTSFIIKMPLAK